MINYEKGRYNVYDCATDELVGRIDEDEFVRSGVDLLYRIDGDEVYLVNSPILFGVIKSGVVQDIKTAQALLRIEAE